MALPEFYHAADGKPISAPVYRIVAETYLDEYCWQPGDIISTGMIPNVCMEPLNAAAGARLETYLNSMPASYQGISQQDLMLAAQRLPIADDKGTQLLTTEQYSAAVIALAKQINAESIASGVPSAAPVQSVRPMMRTDLPPMPNAEFQSTGVGMALGQRGKFSQVKGAPQVNPISTSKPAQEISAP
jgi:hypothetical protein